MKSTKLIAFILVFALVCMLLTACAGGQSASGTSGKVDKSLKGEVTLLAWLPDNPDIVENWTKSFTQKYPNIKVNAQMMTGQGLVENLEPRFAANTIPDVFSFELDPFSKSQVKAGKIADIGDTKAWNDMVPAMQAAWTYEGVKYGISGGVCTTLFYYNKDYFTKAGITELPKNFDEFLAACEKLKAAGITPLVWYGGFPNMLSNGPMSWGFANDVLSTDADIIKKIADEKYDFSSNPGWLRMYEKVALLQTKGYFLDGFLSTDYQGGVDQFNNGDAAMIFAGTWQAAYLIDKGGFETGLFIPPWNDAGKELVAVNASETGWSVGKNGNEKLGKVLLDHMFYDDFNTYQNPRGCVTPFKRTEGNKLDAKLAAAMVDLNKIPKFTDLWARNMPTAVSNEGMQLMQGIYIDKKPADVPALLTKVQNDYITTK